MLLGNGLPSGRTRFTEPAGALQAYVPPPMPAAWSDKVERELTLEAHVRESIAWQVRINREERGLTQKQLAEMVRTGQSAVSKIEDPDGGDVRLSSLVKLAHGFDCALQVRFVSFGDFWSFAAAPRSERLLASTFSADAEPLAHAALNKAQTMVAE